MQIRKSMAVSALLLAMGCAGEAGSVSDEQPVEVGDEDAGPSKQADASTPPPPAMPVDVQIEGDSDSLSAPAGVRVTSAAQGVINVVWTAPDKGTAADYVLYQEGVTVGTVEKLAFTFRSLKCGTTYNLEVAARDAALKVSPRAAVMGSTMVCNGTQLDLPAPTDPAQPVAGYAAAVLADKPFAYWRFEGGSATDSAGKHNGTFAGGPKLTDNAASFDGVDDVMNVNDAVDLRLDGSFSIEFMAKLNGTAGPWPGILAKGASGTGATGYIVYYSPQSNQPAFKRAGVDGLAVSAKGTLSSELKHFVFTYDKASMTARWYVAGELDTTYTNISFPANMDSSAFSLGRGDLSGGNVQYGNQTLDEVALYDSALSAERIKAHSAARAQ